MQTDALSQYNLTIANRPILFIDMFLIKNDILGLLIGPSPWEILFVFDMFRYIICLLDYICAATSDFQQCGILTTVDSDVPVQPHFKLRNFK